MPYALVAQNAIGDITPNSVTVGGPTGAVIGSDGTSQSGRRNHHQSKWHARHRRRSGRAERAERAEGCDRFNGRDWPDGRYRRDRRYRPDRWYRPDGCDRRDRRHRRDRGPGLPARAARPARRAWCLAQSSGPSGPAGTAGGAGLVWPERPERPGWHGRRSRSGSWPGAARAAPPVPPRSLFPPRPTLRCDRTSGRLSGTATSCRIIVTAQQSSAGAAGTCDGPVWWHRLSNTFTITGEWRATLDV